MAAVDGRIERGMNGEAAQMIALAVRPRLKLTSTFRSGTALAQELTEGELEKAQLDTADALVLDFARVAQSGQLPLHCGGTEQMPRPARSRQLGYRFDIDVDVVPVVAAVRKVWAGVVWSAVGNLMQGVQSDETGPKSVDRPGGKAHQIGEIATAPVSGGAQTIEADANARGAEVLTVLGSVRSRRTDDEARDATGLAYG